jgi:magnesium transporter
MASTVPLLEELTFESAGSLMSRDVPVARPEHTAAAVRAMLGGRRFEVASHIAVCEEGGRLAGIALIEDVLAVDGAAAMSSVMDAAPPTVSPGTDQEIVAWRAAEREQSALAVVDDQGRFLGMVPPSRLLRVLLREHDEDMARLGGVLRQNTIARTASEESVQRRLWHRLPWLFAGLAGAIFAADIMGAFEARLEDELLLAFFIPGIVYLADAVGTQTETLAIRGLSVGVGIRQFAGRELLTGLLAGLVLAAAFFPVALVRWGEADVALTVSLALVAACSTATAVAMALPWAFDALGRDPAYGSGPLATVVQDLLSITIYLAVATVLV